METNQINKDGILEVLKGDCTPQYIAAKLYQLTGYKNIEVRKNSLNYHLEVVYYVNGELIGFSEGNNKDSWHYKAGTAHTIEHGHFSVFNVQEAKKMIKNALTRKQDEIKQFYVTTKNPETLKSELIEILNENETIKMSKYDFMELLEVLDENRSNKEMFITINGIKPVKRYGLSKSVIVDMVDGFYYVKQDFNSLFI